MRKALTNASASELEKVLGPLGVVLHFKDGSWLAISYRDDHSFLGWSAAVARDSEGAWFESSEHFCGHLKKAALVQTGRLDPHYPTPNDSPKNHVEWICLLGASRDLATVRQRMTRYFHQVE